MVRDITELESVIFLTMHKSISSYMTLWLEIDFKPVYGEEYYGTGIEREKSAYVKKNFSGRRAPNADTIAYTSKILSKGPRRSCLLWDYAGA